MILDNQPSISANLVNHFQQYSFLQKFDNSPHTMHHVFDKEYAKHRILHTIEVSEIAFEVVDQLIEKINLTKNLKHPNLLNCSLAERENLNVHLAIDETNLCPLSEMLEGTRLSFKKTLEIGIQICAAIEHLHTNSITHEGIDVDNVYLDKKYFVKITPPYFQYFLDLSRDPNKPAPSKTHESAGDIRAIGKLLLRMITGYNADEITEKHWERFGVNKLFYPILARLINHPEDSDATELMSELEEIQSALYDNSDISDSCKTTRQYRLKLTEPLNAQNLKSPTYEEEYEAERSNLKFKKRFKIESCVVLNIAKTVFIAKDYSRKGELIWLHVFDKNSLEDWDKSYRGICQRLTILNHPNVSRIYDYGTLSDTAFLTTQYEPGERLTDFIHRRTFTPSQLIELTLQLFEAAAASAKLAFYNYQLTTDTVTVYKTASGKYHYRIIAPGYARLLELIDPEDDYLANILDPRTLAPELYERDPKKFQTTQYILGSIFYKAATGYHPCASGDIDQAYKHNSSYAQYDISRHRHDIPLEYQNWLDTMLHTNPKKRFKDPKEARIFLNKAALSFPIE